MPSSASQLRELIAGPRPVLVPLVLDPLSALTAQQAGFQAMYLGGGTLGYVKACLEAHLSLTRIVDVALEIRATTTLPLILDGQCGWGEPMHMVHTIRMAEAAGVAAIEIEDQLMPKRAHHHIGVEHLIPIELMVDKIKAAAAARQDPDFVIIARTNACRSVGLDEALRRAQAYRAAGADMILVLHKSPEEVELIGQQVEGPLYYMLQPGNSPDLTLDELGSLGYRIVNDASTPFYARQKAMRLAYEALAAGRSNAFVADAADEERLVHEAIGLPHLLEIERRTVER